MSYLIAKPFVMRTMIDWQHQKRLKQHITHSPKQLSMYIYIICVCTCVCACKYLYLYTVYTYVIYFIYFL